MANYDVTLQVTPTPGAEIQLETSPGSGVSESNAEAWAVGKRGGVDVPSTDPTYHNNSKYYAQQADEDAQTASGAKDDAIDAKDDAEAARDAVQSAVASEHQRVGGHRVQRGRPDRRGTQHPDRHRDQALARIHADGDTPERQSGHCADP